MKRSGILARLALLVILPALISAKLPDRLSVAPLGSSTLTCESLQRCSDYIARPYLCTPECDDMAVSGDMIPAEEGYFSLPDEFHKFGQEGINELTRLLSNPDVTVRARAGATLSALHNELQPQDLPGIRQAWLKGNAWLTVAIVRTAAVEPSFVAEMLSQAKGPYARDSGLFERLDLLGDTAYPEMVKFLQCRNNQPCDAEKVRLFATYLKGARAQLANGLRILLDIALNESIDTQPRLAALSGIADSGQSSKSVISGLRPLLASPRPKIRDATSRVLVLLHDPLSVDAELERLKRVRGFERVMILWKIREFGPAAVHAAPIVRDLLADEDWDVRAEAARVLGDMKDFQSISDLSRSITDNDWLLAYRAVFALGQMRSMESDAKLNDVSEHYWLPLVRELANDALANKLDNRKAIRPIDEIMNPLWQYCRRAIAANVYSGDPRLADAKAAPMELRIRNARFFGEDRGEFGGLVAVEVNGTISDLANENLRAFVDTPSGPLAIVGISHMSTDEGYVLRLRPDANGGWNAKREWRLPGAPSVLKAASGAVGVISSAGDMLFTPEGKPEWLGCYRIPKKLK